MWFGYSADSSLPLKLRDNESIGGFQYALALERWTTVGAQVHPAPNIVISAVVFENFLAENRIVYSAGPLGIASSSCNCGRQPRPKTLASTKRIGILVLP